MIWRKTQGQMATGQGQKSAEQLSNDESWTEPPQRVLYSLHFLGQADSAGHRFKFSVVTGQGFGPIDRFPGIG